MKTPEPVAWSVQHSEMVQTAPSGEPVGEVEDAEDSIVTWFVEPTDGMLLYTHPAPVNVLTDELKAELLEALQIGEGKVGWSVRQTGNITSPALDKIHAAIDKLTNLEVK